MNVKNKHRSALYHSFLYSEGLAELPLTHPTYHHFTGDGASDSFLDKILFPSNSTEPEQLCSILCNQDEPLIHSHHDILLSNCYIPVVDAIVDDHTNIVAPKLKNNRHKIIWTEEGIEAYQSQVVPHLLRLQEIWNDSTLSKTCTSLFLQSTNNVMSLCAQETNEFKSLDSIKPTKSRNVPPLIKKQSSKVLLLWKRLKALKSIHPATSEEVLQLEHTYKKEKLKLRKIQRYENVCNSMKRDEKLMQKPHQTYAEIRRKKRENASKISKLKVDSKTYHGNSVQDGFYESVLKLKTIQKHPQHHSNQFDEFLDDYRNIIELCKSGKSVSQVSEIEAVNLLNNMKLTVSDVYSITPSHYLNAGPVGWKHYQHLLNRLLCQVENTTISEVNTAYAIILFKGHGKDRSSSKSYRTISTCPVVAKGLDMFIRDQFKESWNESQADTQFQGNGSSHELAALLLSECIQFSRKCLKKPTFVLYLDAKSAFDVVRTEALLRKLYFLKQEPDNLLLHVDNRLSHRQTVLDWNSHLMGPINDELGLEQGGINSSEFYKIFGKEQLQLAQKSELGVRMRNVTISAIGQADDTVLVSNSIFALRALLDLTIYFCSKNLVELSPEKTKLQIFGASCQLSPNPISVNGVPVPPVEQADHVGLLRSTSGNGPTILARFTAHKRALAAVMQTGLAKGHRSNPVFGMRIEQLYGVPVLFSGLAALILSKKEVGMIDRHYLETIRQILRLYQNTPRSVVLFLAGSLPGIALLHLRQLSLFSMICRLPNNVLHKYALNWFSSENPYKYSWFQQIVDISVLYKLPSPQTLFLSPLKKDEFKLKVKKLVVSYWEETLRREAGEMKSLTNFMPAYMSILTPHPLWKTAGNSSYKITMATIQAKMLSGRYRTGALTRYWKSSSQEGFCTLSPACAYAIDDLNHILVDCPALTYAREWLTDFTVKFSTHLPFNVQNVLLRKSDISSPFFVTFMLDCSSDPEVILLHQDMGFSVLEALFSVTRTWAYILHRERLKLLGRWRPGHN